MLGYDHTDKLGKYPQASDFILFDLILLCFGVLTHGCCEGKYWCNTRVLEQCEWAEHSPTLWTHRIQMIHPLESWKSEAMIWQEMHHISEFLKWSSNPSHFFPTSSWELRRIRWHELTSHPQPVELMWHQACGQRGPLTSKSSLDQTAASCADAQKQSPKYAYPRWGEQMLIKMNNSNQLM